MGDRTSSTQSALKDILIVASISGVSFLNSFFSGALTASLPTIQRDLQISSANLQWSVSLYALVLAAFLLPAGRLADIWTPRLLFLSGTGVYFIMSIAIARSPTWIAFTCFAAALGLGSAATTPAGIGVLGSYFEPGEAKNRAFASLGAGQPLGFIAGLVIGALLTETKLSWRASFYIQAGITALLAVVGFFSIPSSFPLTDERANADIPLETFDRRSATPDGSVIEDGSIPPTNSGQNSILKLVGKKAVGRVDNKKVDWLGVALSVIGLVLFTFALADAQAEKKGWRTPFLPPLIPVSFLILVGFFYWERVLHRRCIDFDSLTDEEQRLQQHTSPPPPLLSPDIWGAPHLLEILAVIFFAWSGFNTATYFINLILQLVLLTSPIKTALYFLPMIIAGTIFNIIPGYLLGRVNGKTLVVISLLMSLIGPALMAVTPLQAPYWQYLFVSMIFLPSVDILYTIATVQISKSVTRNQQATAGALFNVTTRLATAISLSVISTVSTSTSANYLAKHSSDSQATILTIESPIVLFVGYKVAGWMCFGCLFIALLLGSVRLRGLGIVGRKDGPDEEGEREETAEDSTKLTRRRVGDGRAVAPEESVEDR